MDERVTALAGQGFAWVRDCFGDPDEAFAAARALIGACSPANRVLDIVGDFVLPPLDGQMSRAFQTLHFDFGIPLDPKVPQDVARYTALHIPNGVGAVSAVTRLVPLKALLEQRGWPPRAELLARLVAYGRTHGAWDDADGYVEGSLARIVEAAAGSPVLPSVKHEPEFLCGLEFDSLRCEVRFFENHSLHVQRVQREIPLGEGELLVFDNLAVAHGRCGVRWPGELRQRAFGERALGVAGQCELRDRLLASFGGGRSLDAELVSVPASAP